MISPGAVFASCSYAENQRLGGQPAHEPFLCVAAAHINEFKFLEPLVLPSARAMIRIVCAPNAFKESLSASHVCAAIGRGCARAAARLTGDRRVDFKSVPMADGGDGSMDVLVDSDPGARRVSVSVLDPVCRVITAQYGVLDDGATAIIEMARASGLWLVSGTERDATRTTSFGTGQLLAHALETLPLLRKVIMCIGGSATNDGGAGFAAALGYRFLDEQDAVIQHPGLLRACTISDFKHDRKLFSWD